MTVKEPSADETLQAQGMKWFTPHGCGAMQRVWRISKNAPLPSRTIGPWSDAIPVFQARRLTRCRADEEPAAPEP